MDYYTDVYVFPIAEKHLELYQYIAKEIAALWIKHGALSYQEQVGDELNFPATRKFPEISGQKADETVVVGWVTFASKSERDRIHQSVRDDQRMHELVAPLMDPKALVFDAKRMVFGGFNPLVSVSK